MKSLKEMVLALWAGEGDPDPRAYAHGVCKREGPAAVVAAVTDLIAEDATTWLTATYFLSYAQELPEVEAALLTSPALHGALLARLASPDTRTRLATLGRLGSFPESFATKLQAEADEIYHRERDLISLVQHLCASSPLVPSLFAEEDWLVRWSLARAVDSYDHEPESIALRARLASDPHPLIAGEIAQQLANIERRGAEAAAMQAASETKGWIFYTPSPDEGDAPRLRTLASAFVEGWPAAKTSYTLEELRAFVLAETGGRPKVSA